MYFLKHPPNVHILISLGLFQNKLLGPTQIIEQRMDFIKTAIHSSCLLQPPIFSVVFLLIALVIVSMFSSISPVFVYIRVQLKVLVVTFKPYMAWARLFDGLFFLVTST